MSKFSIAALLLIIGAAGFISQSYNATTEVLIFNVKFQMPTDYVYKAGKDGFASEDGSLAFSDTVSLKDEFWVWVERDKVSSINKCGITAVTLMSDGVPSTLLYSTVSSVLVVGRNQHLANGLLAKVCATKSSNKAQHDRQAKLGWTSKATLFPPVC